MSVAFNVWYKPSRVDPMIKVAVFILLFVRWYIPLLVHHVLYNCQNRTEWTSLYTRFSWLFKHRARATNAWRHSIWFLYFVARWSWQCCRNNWTAWYADKSIKWKRCCLSGAEHVRELSNNDLLSSLIQLISYKYLPFIGKKLHWTWSICMKSSCSWTEKSLLQ